MNLAAYFIIIVALYNMHADWFIGTGVAIV